MSEASKRRKQTAQAEAKMTGRVWESDRARKRARPDYALPGHSETVNGVTYTYARGRRVNHRSEHGAALLNSAARFAERDDKARSRRRYYRIDPARGDGGKVQPKPEPVIIYNESARSLLGY